jgi:hypothetical protein
VTAAVTIVTNAVVSGRRARAIGRRADSKRRFASRIGVFDPHGLEVGSVDADLGGDVGALAEALADYRADRAGLRARSELGVEDQPARGHERRAVIGELIGEEVLEAAVHLCAHDLREAARDQVGVKGVRAGEAREGSGLLMTGSIFGKSSKGLLCVHVPLHS